MNDCLFPEFRFVTLAEHVVDTDLIAFNPITASSVNTKALLLLDPFALSVLFQKSNSSVRSEPKAYPWLLDARQVHISVLLVVTVEDIAQEFLEEFISADLGNGARSSQVGRFVPRLALETASEGTVDVIVIVDVDLRLAHDLRCVILLPCVSLIVELLIGIVEPLVELLT